MTLKELIQSMDYTNSCFVHEEQLKSVHKFEIIDSSGIEKCLVYRKGNVNFSKYIKLITDDFILEYYGGSTLLLFDNTGTELNRIPVDITEEWFFQQSVINNYSTVQHEDILFLNELYHINIG